VAGGDRSGRLDRHGHVVGELHSHTFHSVTRNEDGRTRIALVTGGSRGIGAATVLALCRRGCDVAFTYRSRHRRAEQVLAEASATGRRVAAFANDMTDAGGTDSFFRSLREWTDRLHVLVLNASGGLEPGADAGYAMRINRDAQQAFAERARPLLVAGATVVLVTSHWAHRYGEVAQLPAYAPIAESKHAGEQALREQFSDPRRGVRLLVVTGDLVEGTVTPRLLERASRGLADHRRHEAGSLPTAADMGEAIAGAAVDEALPAGHTVVVGGDLGSLDAPAQ
jgi:NAD(P)-dependent dehydrogenase (short-subunit alcohol dehydrogenase family)